ncbi:uncharacterized protein LOC111277755 isoform X2 [Durio zibethinus]|uniref:Uncharacterized protein LOC111277755 isoform X2 n=1 Tax=Durio zibethinus TaxID=66656 RepID=A0A6P5WWN0_DURZI|nr:uncharacterized protein LOC111277755 isoform X2 [Durio zibethinus]
MSSALVAGASSSCSAAFTSRNHSIKATTTSSPKAFTPFTSQKTTVQGLPLQEAKKGASGFFLAERKGTFSSSHARRGIEITARTIEVEVDKPLGLTLGC